MHLFVFVGWGWGRNCGFCINFKSNKKECFFLTMIKVFGFFLEKKKKLKFEKSKEEFMNENT